MADWRQIQARIRKAKNSPDAQAKLSELYQRTRDAMVAWELGAIEEKAERKDEAGNWYTIAAQRFRRADWKKKAEEALTRLGIALPPPQAETAKSDRMEVAPESPEVARHESQESDEETPALAVGEIAETSESEEDAASESSPQTASAVATAEQGPRKRRRGRRGGRGRRRKGAPSGAPGLPSQAFAESAEPRRPQPVAARSPAPERPERVERPERSDRTEHQPRVREQAQLFESPRPARTAEPPAPQLSERSTHGRAGDPALASRMAYLESMLRRLVASPLHRMDEADEAPAGPGVFLLSDSDLITSYYVEACQTLRIGCGNLARGGRSGKNPRAAGRGYSESGLKGKLADYLGIGEAKVSQYMKDHCVLRWIQLDDDAQLLAHFAVGVLRTPLNLNVD
jgi:hypothetical protein